VCKYKDMFVNIHVHAGYAYVCVCACVCCVCVCVIMDLHVICFLCDYGSACVLFVE